MSVEMFGRMIQMILAPVVMITACGLVLSGLWSHFTSINERLRLMMRERLDLLRGSVSGSQSSSTVLVCQLQRIENKTSETI